MSVWRIPLCQSVWWLVVLQEMDLFINGIVEHFCWSIIRLWTCKLSIPFNSKSDQSVADCKQTVLEKSKLVMVVMVRQMCDYRVQGLLVRKTGKSNQVCLCARVHTAMRSRHLIRRPCPFHQASMAFVWQSPRRIHSTNSAIWPHEALLPRKATVVAFSLSLIATYLLFLHVFLEAVVWKKNPFPKQSTRDHKSFMSTQLYAAKHFPVWRLLLQEQTLMQDLQYNEVLLRLQLQSNFQMLASPVTFPVPSFCLSVGVTRKLVPYPHATLAPLIERVEAITDFETRWEGLQTRYETHTHPHADMYMHLRTCSLIPGRKGWTSSVNNGNWV